MAFKNNLNEEETKTAYPFILGYVFLIIAMFGVFVSIVLLMVGVFRI